MDHNLYEPISQDSRTKRVVDVLSELITSGKVAAGDFFPSEPDLCKRLGVSRSTLRQALRTLEARGLIVTKRGVGVQVVDRTRDVAIDSIGRMLLRHKTGQRDLLEIRLMLECQGAALAALRATEEDVQALSASIANMTDETSTVEEYVGGDLAFHIQLAEASKNAVLVTMIHAIRELLYETIASTYPLSGRTRRRLDDHTRVFNAIAARDPAAAFAAMHTHLQNTEHTLTQAGWLQPGEDQQAGLFGNPLSEFQGVTVGEKSLPE